MSDATPFRSHICGELRLADVNSKVTLIGFVDGSKMEGKAIDLRDRTGAVSCLMPEKPSAQLDETWGMITPESVVQVTGRVMTRKRRDHAMPTGEILVMIEALTLVSGAEALPPELAREALGEEDRFRYRMLYLRRAPMQDRLAFRSRFLLETRKHLVDQGFVEVETPLLARAGGDPAASFLVPVAEGKGYGLPASPQLFKQALIAGGIERYFQIARCFRNEADTSPERQPEFSVLDLELAYQDEKAILGATEKLLAHVLKAAVQADVKLPIERIPYETAVAKYGNDRPDLRARFEIADATGTARSLGATDLAEALGPEGAARVLRVEGGVERLGDTELELLTGAITRKGNARATWIKFGAQTGLRGPGTRYFGPRSNDALSAFGARQGDAVILSFAKTERPAQKAAAELRRELARMIGDKDTKNFACAFITSLPFFTLEDDEKTWTARRHPFTQPRDEDLKLMDDAEKKTSVRAKAFTLVINGVEIGSGSLRNHDLRLQDAVFKLLGIKPVDVQKRYGAALDNFRYGVPPHGGITLQVDRLLALATGVDAIDEVMAFPKSRSGGDLMFETPMPLDSQYLRGLLG